MKRCKEVFVILFMLIFAMSSITVYAKEEKICFQLDDSSNLNPADYEAANAELMAVGHMARMSRSYKYLTDVPHYFQSGKSWSNDIMQTCGKTIGEAGCCVTSFTMIVNFFEYNQNPGEVNAVLEGDACPFNYTNAGSKYDLTIANYKYGTVSDDDAITFIIGAISLGKPVLVGMHPDGNGNQHFVTAYGYSGDTIYIRDPASNRNYTTLAQYLSSYHVDRLYVYNE